MRRERAGVTLIEVLIAIGVVGVLSGVMIPAIGQARAGVRSVSCQAMQRQLYAETMSWAHSHRERLPGVNTTGRAYYGPGSRNRRKSMHYHSSPVTPTSIFDWISPVMGHSAGLSSNRARRTKQIFEDLGCAATITENHVLYGRALDREDFQELMTTEGIGQISYLAPGPFHLLGSPGWGGGLPKGPYYEWRGPARTPQGYLPRLDRVGTVMAEKIFLADGTRYVASDGTLDFDITVNPEYYGSFTSSTPIYRGSTAYGRSPHLPEFFSERHPSKSSYPMNRNLSYRHGRRMNVIYFDGHAGSMNEIESKTDAAPWYPTGSVFTGANATPESRARHNVDDVLH